MQVAFQRLSEDDIALVHRWLQSPVLIDIWTHGESWSRERVAEKYGPRIRGEEPTEPFLILADGEPVGYIQWYLWRSYPEYSVHLGLEEEAASLDLFIGEEAYRGAGRGPQILREFLREVIFARSEAVSCVITPEARNERALRAYEKAGFRRWKVMLHPDEPGPICLMRIERSSLSPRQHLGVDG